MIFNEKLSILDSNVPEVIISPPLLCCELNSKNTQRPTHSFSESRKNPANIALSLTWLGRNARMSSSSLNPIERAPCLFVGGIEWARAARFSSHAKERQLNQNIQR